MGMEGVMLQLTQRRSVVTAVWVMSIVGLGIGQTLLQNTADAQHVAVDSPKQDPVYLPPGSRGLKVTGHNTLGAYSFTEAIAQPGEGPVPHRHSREDEGFYVLEGGLEFRIGDQVIAAAPGSFVFAPRGIPHTYKNVGTTPARYLVIISPAGLDKFFGERTALQKEIPTTDPSYAVRYKALTEKYGLEYSSDWSFTSKAND
jgi:quercetin dioxygenase-like cupin family protein